jgi:2-dehydro-3-deoxy-L-rhamnonate dehydrogenase (NAD+)
VEALPQAAIDYMTAKIPLRRCGELAEAVMVAWIVSSARGFTSGFTFDLSGGHATYWQPRLKHPLRSSTGRLI